MLFTYKNKRYQALESIQKNSLKTVLMSGEDVQDFFNHPIRQLFNETFKEYNELFKADIKFLSRPFSEAFEKALPSLAEKFDEVMWQLKPASGIFLWEDKLIMYCVGFGEAGGITVFNSIFSDSRLSFVGAMTLYKGDYEEKATYWISKHYNKSILGNPVELFAWPIALLMFMQFAEIETKDVNPKKKVVHEGEKHKNETDLKIQMVGCSWFTNLIRSEGFGVKGHFRLQPCGPERQERKLIWINEFQKHGYRRRAQIIVNEEKES